VQYRFTYGLVVGAALGNGGVPNGVGVCTKGVCTMGVGVVGAGYIPQEHRDLRQNSLQEWNGKFAPQVCFEGSTEGE
jgi:hypothetical protein